VRFRVNLNAGKMKIRKAVKELLKQYTPRDTEPDRRFHPDKWKMGYEIYQLNLDGLKLEQIAEMVGRPYPTVQRLLAEIAEHITQKPYGTKRQRLQDTDEDYPFDDSNFGWGASIGAATDKTPEDAALLLVKSNMLGGIGASRTPSRIEGRDDEQEDKFFDWKTEYAEKGKAFADGWARRYGHLTECLEEHPTYKGSCSLEIPPWGIGFASFKTPSKSKMKWIDGYLQCKRVPGSENCSGCYQISRRVYYGKGLKAWRIEPGKAVPRAKKLEQISPYPPKWEKDSPHYQRIDDFIRIPYKIDRERELKLQAEYIAENGITLCPEKIARGFGPRWGFRIRYWPIPQVPCAVCNIICDNGLCDDLWKWLNKNFRVPRKIIDIFKWSHSQGQYSLAFTLRKDLLEWLIVNQIDQRAKKSRPK
jgi:hypothetical protein